MTPGQLSRSERDYVIAAAAVHGIDERMLSRVFNLAPSRVHNIIVAMCQLHDDLKRHREEQRPTYRQAFRPHADRRKRERPRRDE